MPNPTTPTVVLVGPPAAGKTKVGKELARQLGERFVDTDREIEAAHGSIPEIFAHHGEAEFRRLEREAVTLALAGEGVVSLGGGAVISEDTRRDLQAHPVVALSISDEAVLPRLDNPKRPLLQSGGIAAWKALVEPRMPWYREVAKVVIDVSHRPVEDVAREIRQWLEASKESG